MLEETPHVTRPLGDASHVRERLFPKLLFGLGGNVCMYPPLEIVVEVLIRVQLRRIRRR